MKSAKNLLLFLLPVSLIIISLISCASESGQIVISRPDEYRHTYEANEKVILNATARVFRDKSMGKNVRKDREKKQVETDYIIQGDWRTKSFLQVKKLNWKESQVVLSVITEKQTNTGWEMRRLLDTEQYIKLFDTIELAIYEELSRME
jgi:hypothetical protein